jgi:outer membrane receptor protein involved in Fe transport
VASILLAAAGSAMAQQTEGGGDDLDVVVVTGSRLAATAGFEAPTPVTVVSAEQLRQAAPTSLSDSLNQLPVFRNSSTPQSTGVGTTGNVGQSFLNLRSLGSQRTLILLDGRRVVPSTDAGSTDVSILPDMLVQRVDVVTGGASAGYGSDAVAGVVNFALDTRFEGIKANVQGTISEAGDAGGPRFELAAGTSFAGGRGHLIGSLGYYKNTGIVRWADRDWYDSCSRIATPPGGATRDTIACGVVSAGFTGGGLINASNNGPIPGNLLNASNALRNNVQTFEFGPGGVPIPFFYGSTHPQLGNNSTDLAMVGGSGVDHGANFPAMPGVERKTAFAHVLYDVSDNFSVFVDGLFGEAKAHYASTAPWEGQRTSSFTIFSDNYFLHQSIKDIMNAAGEDRFEMSRYDYDFGLLTVDSRNRTTRFTLGGNYKFGDGWELAAYYAHGENNYYQTTLNNPMSSRLYNAVDVIDDGTGNPICRSTLAQPNNGCVPLNLFGQGSPSPDALAWVTGTSWVDNTVKQDVAEVSVQGSPFSTWAGEVALAAGAGYRRESSNQTVDDVSPQIKTFTGDYLGWPAAGLQGQLGGWERGNQQPLSGSYNVKEAFVEAGIPLLKDSAAGSLDFNAAARYTDYSTSGGVTTWKVGMVYEPIPDIKLRATLSRDIRAANLREMYTGSIQGQATVDDPRYPDGSNARPAVITRSFGNPNLDPEEADTIAAGIVLQPRFLPGFSASIDYFNIDISGAVGTLGTQVIIQQCDAGATALCDLLTRDPATDKLVSVDLPFLNISRRQTDGFDIELAYRVALDAGVLTLRGLSTYVHELTTENPGAAPRDAAGENGLPHWVANLSADFRTHNGWGVYVQERYFGSTILDTTLTAAQLPPEMNRVSSVLYTDLTVSKQFGAYEDGDGLGTELFVTVNNLLNKNPPLAPSGFFVFGVSNGGTNPSLYDIVGRQYSAGIRLRW